MWSYHTCSTWKLQRFILVFQVNLWSVGKSCTMLITLYHVEVASIPVLCLLRCSCLLYLGPPTQSVVREGLSHPWQQYRCTIFTTCISYKDSSVFFHCPFLLHGQPIANASLLLTVLLLVCIEAVSYTHLSVVDKQ